MLLEELKALNNLEQKQEEFEKIKLTKKEKLDLKIHQYFYKTSGSRKILEKCKFVNFDETEYQVITNSYVMLFLTDEKINKVFAEETEGRYPAVDQIYRICKNYNENYIEANVDDFKLLLKKLKQAKIKTIELQEDSKYCYDIKLLNVALEALNYNKYDNITIKFLYNGSQIVIENKKEKSFATVVAIRKTDNK